MDIVILQTSDPHRYKRMLDATSRTATEYCRRHDLAYESYVGIKRGIRGAHAAFNRILMLDEMIARGYRGWALHMDADAYVYDLDFDLRLYLGDKRDRSAIMATIPGETVPWHINSGVLFFNLAHPQGIALVREWKRRFMLISDAELQALVSVWDGENDQIMLYKSLNQHPELRASVCFEDAMLFNHHQAQFIRQFLNSLDGNLETRTETIEAAVREVLARGGGARDMSAEEKLVRDLYRVILGRDADAGSQGYVALLAAQGIPHAAVTVVRELLNSEEYRRRVNG